jgi:hypothetical protein
MLVIWNPDPGFCISRNVSTIIDQYDRKETLPLKESKESKEKDLAQLFSLCIELYGKHINRRYSRDV